MTKEKGSGDPATPISLETDEAASRLLLPHSPSQPPSPLPSLNDVFVPAVTNRVFGNFSRRTFAGRKAREGGVFPSTVMRAFCARGVNIGVKRRGHERSPAPRTRRGSESNYVHCAEHKSRPVGRITTASYLAPLCLPFSLNSQNRREIYTLPVCIRFPRLLFGCHSQHRSPLR